MIRNLPTLRIGPFQLDIPVILAAMAGYTDLPYRMLCRQLGAPYCATEMMLDRQLLLPGKLRRRLVRIGPEDHPVAGQIIGNDPSVMAKAAAELCKCGFDVVDINIACPVRKVLSRRRGGYLLKEPGKALDIIRAVVAAADRPVTVKIRIGFDAPERPGGAFWRIAEGAFDAGAVALCVHARTVAQRYKGPADWEFLARVKRHFGPRTIIGSGDAGTPAAVAGMIRQTGVDGVAVARAALGNPWFFRQFRDYLAGRPLYQPPLAEQRELLQRHFDEVVAFHGPRQGPKIMRKYGIKYARLHPSPARLRQAFVGVKSPDQWRAVLEQFYTDGETVGR